MENFDAGKISKEEWENFEQNLIDFARVYPENFGEAVLYYSKARQIGEQLLSIAKMTEEDTQKVRQCMEAIYERMKEYPKQREKVSKMKPKDRTKETKKEEPKYEVKTKPILTLANHEEGKVETFFHLDTLFHEDDEGNEGEFYVLLPVFPRDEDHENTVGFFQIFREEETGDVVMVRGVSNSNLCQQLFEQFLEKNEEDTSKATAEGDEIGEKYEITATDSHKNTVKYLYRGTVYRKNEAGVTKEYLAVSPAEAENKEDMYVLTFLEVERNSLKQIMRLIPVKDNELAQELVNQFNEENPDLEI